MDHEYQPDPKTGQCMACPPRSQLSGCLWCSHATDFHTGNVDPVVLKHYEIEVPGPVPVKSSSVRWTPTACGARHCACRKYEIRSRR